MSYRWNVKSYEYEWDSNVFFAHDRLPLYTLDMKTRSCVFVHFDFICVYEYLCWRDQNRITEETLGKESNDNANVYKYLGVYPHAFFTLMREIVFEPSQIATVTSCDKPDYSNVAICEFLAICH